MKEKKVVDDLLALLTRNKATENYFSKDIQWLEERKRYWEQHRIRVGLVGVTSSGKSTLLNAIMGNNLLPTAVRPSSGILVTCAKGFKDEATVYFEKDDPLTLSGPDLAVQLESYADERSNQDNRKGVTYIDLKSSCYQIDSVIQIVDSPGLDAHGLERHEALTMETLLPTVDVCLFVVTLKANTDESTYRVIKSVNDHKKPLIVVQNMLDSVEEKKGQEGIILKTREEVALEHRHRVQRIIGMVEPKLEDRVMIVQVSAKQALQAQVSKESALYEASRFSSLIALLQQQVDQLRPYIAQGRMLQIKRHLEGMLLLELESRAEFEQESEQFGKQHTQLSQWTAQERKLTDSFIEVRKLTSDEIKQIRQVFEQTNRELKALENKDVSSASEKLQVLKKKVEASENSIIRMTRSYDQDLKTLRNKLNLNEDDYKADLQLVKKRNANAFTLKRKIIQESHMSKKNGRFAKVTRGIGKILGNDWGYEQKERDVEIIDHEALRSHLKVGLSRSLEPITSYLSSWEFRMLKLLEIATKEIGRREEDSRSKAVSIQEKKEMDDVVIAIQNLMEQAGQPLEGSSQMKSETAATQAHREVKVQSYPDSGSVDANVYATERTVISIGVPVFDVYRLSYKLLMNHFATVFAFAERWRDQETPEYETSVIWGWDAASIMSFCSRFLHGKFNDKELDKLLQHGVLYKTIEGHRYIVVDEIRLDEQGHKGYKQLFSLLNDEPYRTYLLVNTVQHGAAIKQIRNSLLNEVNLTKQSVIHWVSQSFMEFIEGSNAAEGLQSLVDISTQFSYRRGIYLINDPNPVYSLLLAELSLKQRLTIDEEEKVMSGLSKACGHLIDTEIRQRCADLMKTFVSIKGANVQ